MIYTAECSTSTLLGRVFYRCLIGILGLYYHSSFISLFISALSSTESVILEYPTTPFEFLDIYVHNILDTHCFIQ